MNRELAACQERVRSDVWFMKRLDESGRSRGGDGVGVVYPNSAFQVGKNPALWLE